MKEVRKEKTNFYNCWNNSIINYIISNLVV